MPLVVPVAPPPLTTEDRVLRELDLRWRGPLLALSNAAEEWRFVRHSAADADGRERIESVFEIINAILIAVQHGDRPYLIDMRTKARKFLEDHHVAFATGAFGPRAINLIDEVERILLRASGGVPHRWVADDGIEATSESARRLADHILEALIIQFRDQAFVQDLQSTTRDGAALYNRARAALRSDEFARFIEEAGGGVFDRRRAARGCVRLVLRALGVDGKVVERFMSAELKRDFRVRQKQSKSQA